MSVDWDACGEAGASLCSIDGGVLGMENALSNAEITHLDAVAAIAPTGDAQVVPSVAQMRKRSIDEVWREIGLGEMNNSLLNAEISHLDKAEAVSPTRDAQVEAISPTRDAQVGPPQGRKMTVDEDEMGSDVFLRYISNILSEEEIYDLDELLAIAPIRDAQVGPALSHGRRRTVEEVWRESEEVEDILVEPGAGLEEATGMVPVGRESTAVTVRLEEENQQQEKGKGSMPSNAPESSASRPATLRDTGKAPGPQASSSDMPFKDHHLKQVRAQCLVFLAFRNGLMPKKAHLEIALGNFFPKEDGPRRDLIEHKRKEQSINDSNRFPEGSRTSGVLDHSRSIDRLPSGTPSTGTHAETRLLKESDTSTSMEEEKSQNAAVSEHADDRRHHLESQAPSLRGMQSDSDARNVPVSDREHNAGNNHQQIAMPNQASFVMGPTEQMRPDMSSWMGNGCQTETSKASLSASAVAHESLMQRKENVANYCRGPADSQSLGNRSIDSNLPGLLPREQWKPVSAMNGQNNPVMPVKESDVVLRTVTPAQELDMEGEDASITTDKPPKYTMPEKRITERLKRKFLTDKMWAVKQRKTEQRIAACSSKLKDKRGTKQIVAATFSLGIGSSVFGDRNGSSQTSAVKGPHSVKDNGRAKQNVGATSSSRNTEVQQGSSTQQLMTEVNDINRVNVVCTEPDGTNFSKKQRKVWTLDREYGISHNVLEQHFGKKLEDVADILGVSRSTLKRICRKHHIFRWPSSRAKKFKCFLTRQEFVHTTEENVKKPQRNQLLCNLPLEKYSLSSAQTRSNAARVLNDSSSIMVKATHRGGIIRFLLSVSSRRSDLEEEVSTRLRLSVGSFKIKYLDEDDDWVLITCDADLRTCMSTLGSVGKTKINILVDQM